MKFDGKMVRILSGHMEGFYGEAYVYDEYHGWYGVDLSAVDPLDGREVWPLCEDDLELVDAG